MSHEPSDTASLRADPHLECQDLLPWLVNGRLHEADRTRLEHHLAGCEECRAELALQKDLCRRMAADDRVAYSPAASFEKLWSRIEELEREVPAAQADPPAVRAFKPRLRVPGNAVLPLSRWLAAAVVVQAIALGWLVSVFVARDAAPPWAYRTVTSSTAFDPQMPRFRVVFAAQATVTEQQQLLARRGLDIVGGPSLSGVYVLAPAERAGLVDAALLLAELRAEQAVRYAELAQ